MVEWLRCVPADTKVAGSSLLRVSDFVVSEIVCYVCKYMCMYVCIYVCVYVSEGRWREGQDEWNKLDAQIFLIFSSISLVNPPQKTTLSCREVARARSAS